MGVKTSGETMQSLSNTSRRCAHVSAIFSPPGCALPKRGAGKEAIVFTTCYVTQWGAKVRHTVGLEECGPMAHLLWLSTPMARRYRNILVHACLQPPYSPRDVQEV